MFIADRFQVIKDYEGNTVGQGMIEKLDEMLTENGVEHFFSLPEGDKDGAAIRDDEVLYCYYDASKDAVAFLAIYVLWAKRVRGFSDERIKAGVKRHIEEH